MDTNNFSCLSGWRLLRKKSSLPNGFPRDTTSDRDSNSEGSDSARTQIEFPTWNSHESTQRFLDTAEDKRYYRIWIDPSDSGGSCSSTSNNNNSNNNNTNSSTSSNKTMATASSTINSMCRRANRYETVFPPENPPPPLPPRSYHLKHRPLERTKAVEHCSSSPPKVSRQHKPIFPSDAPVVPPRPLKKFINPEDAFNFEIIDIDEQSDIKPSAGRCGKAAAMASELDIVGRSTRYCVTDKTHPHEGIINNHSSQNCDIKVAILGRTNFLKNVTAEVQTKSREHCSHEGTAAPGSRLSVPEMRASVSPISPDSGVAFSEAGCRDCSGSSTESEFETARKRDGYQSRCGGGSGETVNGVRGHKLLSRQISHPPDNCSSQFLRTTERIPKANISELQCPPTPTHRPRRFRSEVEPPTSPKPLSAALAGVRQQQLTCNHSPVRRRKAGEMMRTQGSDSSNSDSDAPSQSLRQRMVRLPSISENSQIQKVEVLPDGDRLPPGEYFLRVANKKYTENSKRKMEVEKFNFLVLFIF